MLKDLVLLPIYENPQHDIIQDLIIPLLRESNCYFRGVGFFSSSWLRMAAEGLLKLVENGGIGKIVMSPILSDGDWEAIRLGDEAKSCESLRGLLLGNISSLRETLEKDTLSALAWMISDGVLEIRFALPREKSGGNYHDKVGVFSDASGDMVAIHGSFNDSAQATLNLEAFSVFKSWEAGQEPYVKSHFTRLQDLFNGGNQQFRTIPIPEAVRDEIVSLRCSLRPYKLPRLVNISLNTLSCPFPLRPFQIEAINKWFEHGNRGVLEMATGTGKTITSLAAALDLYKARGKLGVLIIVPYLHLLEQWADVCRRFGMMPILCSGQHSQWKQSMISKLQDFKIGSIDFFCFIAIQHTASSSDFMKCFKQVVLDNLLEIVDEAHYLGASRFRGALLEDATFRLGLSATPNRWFDHEGTKVLENFFGGTCYEFPLSRAISEGFLTTYEYFPIIIHLEEDELFEYERLTERIRIVSKISQRSDPEDLERKLSFLLIERSRVVTNAREKTKKLLTLMQMHRDEELRIGKRLCNALVYCPSGGHKDILQALSATGFNCHEFVHSVPLQERLKVLSQFEQETIQILVAIKCLDEGVDVPGTRRAYFLASTTNPKEFIQRRGRILRTCIGKSSAAIFDFLVMPDLRGKGMRDEIATSLIKREIPRFSEFSRCASNEFQARSEVRKVLDSYGLLHLLDREPWEVYQDGCEDEFFHLEGENCDQGK